MPCIFDAIQPLSNRERTTRSRTRSLRTLKRVVANDGTQKDEFEHFCNISLNDRITGIMQIDMYEPVIIHTNLQFLKNYHVCESSSSIRVTVPCESGRKSPSKPQIKSLKRTKTRNPLNNNDVHNASLQSKPNAQVLHLNSELNSENIVCEEDDVIIVNPADENVIVIEDSFVAPNNEYIPLTSQTDSATLKSTSDVSFIDIQDEEEDKDVIFVKEEVNNPYNNRQTKKLQAKKKKFERRKAKQNRKKKRLKEATLRFFCASTISELLKKRCVKCIKLSSEEAKRCSCKKGLDGLTNTSVVARSRSQSPRKSSSANREFNPIICSPQNNASIISPRSKSRSPRKSLNNNVQVPFSGTQNIPPLLSFRASGSLREIVIDGSNVAFGHSNGKHFSVKGLQIAIDYFVKRGHKVVAFVPQFRQKHNQTTNRNLLLSLADKGYVVFTPSREVNGRRITPYDDRYIIQYAAACEGVVVSSDNYRDLFMERLDWRTTIERRLLMPTWVGDMLMFPEDPLGRHGPNLSRFLRFP
ncbi:hypothetical protein PPYR_01681 [Photinus pyralis]|uniref:RNase NYN domain-containing protein n=1 Tax=Photinus pyralis TaxID=7054 RepID=A0A5N4B519_PHOPY|nr:NEDD4-binding protein 1-like [Photinus pyralis]KAB0804711.1 hypothetical protein PPYR_01681 [Photinus pyralis]